MEAEHADGDAVHLMQTRPPDHGGLFGMRGNCWPEFMPPDPGKYRDHAWTGAHILCSAVGISRPVLTQNLLSFFSYS